MKKENKYPAPSAVLLIINPVRVKCTRETGVVKRHMWKPCTSLGRCVLAQTEREHFKPAKVKWLQAVTSSRGDCTKYSADKKELLFRGPSMQQQTAKEEESWDILQSH